MVRAFVSYINRVNNSDPFIGGFPMTEKGKLSLLWFDELIVRSPLYSIPEEIIWYEERKMVSLDAIKELKKIYLPIQKYMPDYKFLEFFSNNPKNKEHGDDKLFSEAYSIAVDYYETQYPGHEENLGTLHYKSIAAHETYSTVKTWVSLNEGISHTFIADKSSEKLVKRFFNAANSNKEFDTFSDALQVYIPDISKYSIEETLELRTHPFFEDFRKKITLLQIELEKTHRLI